MACVLFFTIHHSIAYGPYTSSNLKAARCGSKKGYFNASRGFHSLHRAGFCSTPNVEAMRIPATSSGPLSRETEEGVGTPDGTGCRLNCLQQLQR